MIWSNSRPPRPLWVPADYAQFTFKKTSWKKAATFLKKYLEKEGVIKTKDRGGETVVLSINWDHELIVDFQPYRLSSKEVSKPGSAKNDTESTNQTLQIRELYKPAGKALKAILEAQSKSYIPICRQRAEKAICIMHSKALSQYATMNPDLVDPRNAR